MYGKHSIAEVLFVLLLCLVERMTRERPWGMSVHACGSIVPGPLRNPLRLVLKTQLWIRFCLLQPESLAQE